MFYGDHNIFTNNQGASMPFRNQLIKVTHHSGSQVIAKLYGNGGEQSHTLCLDWRGEHSNIVDCNRNVDCNNKVSMQILNKKVYNNKNWVDMVYLMGEMIR